MAALGCVLREGRRIDDLVGTFGTAGVDVFTDVRNRRIYGAMLDLRAKELDIDIVTVSDCLSGSVSRAYVTQVSELGFAPSNIDAYAGVVLDAYLRRRLAEVGKNIAERASWDKLAPLGELVSFAEAAVLEVGCSDVREDPVSVAEASKDMVEAVATRRPVEQGEFFLSSIPALNQKMTGIFKGELCIVGADPGQGKSSLVLDLCLHNGRFQSLYVAFDETRLTIAQRALISLTGMNRDKLLKRRDITDEDITAVLAAQEELAEVGLWICDETGLHIRDVCSLARRWQRRVGLDILVVDFIQQTLRGEEVSNEVEHISLVARTLKRLAKELDIVVVGVSQLAKRGNYGEQFNPKRIARPNPERLLGSGAILQEANLVLTVHRPWVYIMDNLVDGDPQIPDLKLEHFDVNLEIGEIAVAKNKMGQTGVLKCGFDTRRMRWVPIQEEQEVPF